MLGDFINRCLILLLGYAYPGFECYKTVEKNRVQIEELRFWCKYWIIVAIFTVLEKFADIFISWLPLYGEMKLVLFVYMWYPKTKGTGYVYETVLRPFLSSHENEIDRTLLEWKARAWDYVIFYWQYCAHFGQNAFAQGLQHLASQSTRISPNSTTQKNDIQDQSAPPQMASKQSSFQMKQNSSLSRSKKWPPSSPSTPNHTIHRNISETPTSFEEEDEAYEPEPVTMDEGQDDERVSVKDKINRARARLRRFAILGSS
ncbi:putative HVA22-like protein g [Gastrolobium bilobum]|uniref:putative HVA22-like protein g n=1 Tax=Gastrolobium bilobum TaxID=150636 RepID=UPI002AB15004|nr:putative HVA22-like protein g [Gastrolobium bilobum]